MSRSVAPPAGRTSARASAGSVAPAAASSYTPQRYPGAAPLDPASLHFARRLTYGYTPALAAEMAAAGGRRAWFERQLRPSSIPDAAADGLRAWWPSLNRTPSDLWERQVAEIEHGWVVMADYARWLMMRRLTSQRQVHELMAELWEGHFHVPVNGDSHFVHRTSYGDALRARALGTFTDLLITATTHPAMGLFLDNAISTKTRPNENLGRELLELHTVGRGNYTEADVKDSARILTGYRVDVWKTWAASYRPTDHATGPVRVMGFSHPNADPDGRAVTRAYLTYLARHPATARRVCRRIATKLVQDSPPAALVDHLASVYLASGTSITAVLRALVARPEFLASAGRKVRDPGEDVVGTYRALGATLARPTADGSAVNQLLWQATALGSSPFSWPRPDGPPIDNASWSSGSRALASFSFHWSAAGRWWPKTDIAYAAPTDWLPQASLTFAQLVDHLCGRMLGAPSTPALLQACCEATGYQPSTVVTATHALVKWEFNRLLAILLDSPHHLTR